MEEREKIIKVLERIVLGFVFVYVLLDMYHDRTSSKREMEWEERYHQERMEWQEKHYRQHKEQQDQIIKLLKKSSPSK